MTREGPAILSKIAHSGTADCQFPALQDAGAQFDNPRK
jgi:hypothetical protein